MNTLTYFLGVNTTFSLGGSIIVDILELIILFAFYVVVIRPELKDKGDR